MWRTILGLALVATAGLPVRADQAVSAPLDISKIRVPPGFRIAVFARLPSAPRFMVFAPNGTLLVSLTGSGRIAAVGSDGAARGAAASRRSGAVQRAGRRALGWQRGLARAPPLSTTVVN